MQRYALFCTALHLFPDTKVLTGCSESSAGPSAAAWLKVAVICSTVYKFKSVSHILFIEKVLHIDALYECVCEWVNVKLYCEA